MIFMKRAILLSLATIVVATSCAEPSSQVAGDGAPCDIEKAKEIVYGDADIEIPPEDEELICDKAQTLIEDEENADEADQNPGDPVPPPEPSPIYYEEGIFSESEANEGPPSDFHFSGLWRGVIDDRNIAVFTGWRISDSKEALVRLWDGDPYTGLHEIYFFSAPIPGPISIVKASNPEVLVRSESTGEEAVFDAAKREWSVR